MWGATGHVVFLLPFIVGMHFAPIHQRGSECPRGRHKLLDEKLHCRDYDNSDVMLIMCVQQS